MHDDAADQIQQRMANLRQRLRRQAGLAAHDAKQLFSVKQLARSHPVTTAGLAFAAGYLVFARIIGTKPRLNERPLSVIATQLAESTRRRSPGFVPLFLRGVVSAAAVMLVKRGVEKLSGQRYPLESPRQNGWYSTPDRSRE